MENYQFANHGEEIAIIGMEGRFPGAKNINEFWRNLQNGVDSISFFTDEELLESGIELSAIKAPNYVKARAVLEEVELFDASFFGFNIKEAEITDPQHRIFLECAWSALESAGYNSETYQGAIGVYASAELNTYLFNFYANKDITESVDYFQLLIGNDKDYLTTRVSYKLNLEGPSYTVQTACSSSLVAVHLACQSLLNGECKMALAGGVSINASRKSGYFYTNGGVLSPDGHCRAFDAKAQGTVGGEGVGIVVLKRLEDALADKDCIHAVIKGSAINNDGGNKVSYSAPRIDSQAKVIRTAQVVAEVEPETITYIETHGTGTFLGDPIEIAALTQAFRSSTHKKSFCAIGSVKTNVGHLGVAAGITGLIKTVLALKHKQIPPSLYFQEPNPQIDFINSPFYVNTKLTEWKTNSTPRRAGVSSFGVGGTNAHVIIEEAPMREQGSRGAGEQGRKYHLIVLSAKTASALETATTNLVEHFQQNPHLNIADVAFTLGVGRRAFEHRRMVVCQNLDDGAKVLETPDPQRVVTNFTEPCQRQIVFMFPGQGAQYVDMGRELYQTEPIFQQQIDYCCELLKLPLKLDLRDILYPSQEQAATAAQLLTQTHITQPALFVIEYALSKLWMAWGIHPEAMIGHSIGEYVAATLAGVFSLEDALALVTIRGQLMQKLPGGAMLAVPLSESEITPLLGEISLAASNAPEMCVVSGTTAAIDELEHRLSQQGVDCRRLHTSHAFHSPMMDSILEPFIKQVSQISLNPPKIPFVSNLTGTWITTDQAIAPSYWAKHLRQMVRFSQGIAELLQESERIFLEVGPGRTLSTLLGKQKAAGHLVLSSLRHPQNQQSDVVFLLNTLGKLWLQGVDVDWSKFYGHEPRHRLILPTYPFERKRYWIAPQNIQYNSLPQNTTSIHETKEILASPFEEASYTLFVGIPNSSQYNQILPVLKEILSNSLGVNSAEINIHTNFLEMGADSLSLLQISRAIEKQLGVQISFRLLLEDFSTVDALALHIVQQLPPEEPTVTASPQETIPKLPNQKDDKPIASKTNIEQIITQHLQVMSKLIDLLPEGKLSQNPSPLLENIQSPGHQSKQLNHTKLSTEIASKNDQVTSSLTPVQQQHLDSLIARFIQRTQESKRLTQAYRSCHANSRAISGFLPSIKEMIYPIHGQRGVGARLWDVDGNEYVDISMGFGTLLFGHSPSFIVEAVQEQMAQGILHGPQSRLAGQVAELICFLTGAERAAFCNDGTEAVMGAIRLARTVTGRSKIALFAGSYHGNFDGVLVKGITDDNGKLRSIPAAAGIPSYIVEDAIALDYGSSESLDVIKAHAHELAAILVEPIQSSRPDWQPKEFLHELRELTKKTGIVLIFDEVITGFRMHPGGIQGLWDIQADITTYGKAVAAGLPIGVIAGKAQFLDALDGGFWNYGDESYPQAETTFFAGTFFKHPLAMSAAYAALNHIKNNSPQLQEKLNQRTTQLVETLNSYFEQTQVPIRVVNFGSLFRFNCQTKLSNLFFYHLLEKGVYVWEGRTFYLSTAHTDADIEKIISAVKQSVVEMQAGEFLPSIHISTNNLSSANAYSNQNSKYARKIPLTEAQKQLWFVAQMGNNASRAYNQSITSHLRGFFNVEAMNRAVQKIVNRHEALRVTFSPEGDHQKIPANLLINIPFIDFSTLEYNERQEKISEMLTTEAQQIFDLEQGPLLRLHIVKLESQHHLLIFTIHHIIADGWSINILLRELSTIYFAECQNVAYKLPKPMQLSDYAQWEASLQQSPAMAKAEAYWLKQFAGTVPVLELPTTRSRLAVNTYQGSRQKIKIDTALYADLKRLSGQCNCTLLTTLLAGFIVLIHRLSSQQDIVVGIVSAGQSAFKDGYLVGHCVNLLPIRTQVIGDAKFTEYLNTVKQVLLDAYEHQIYPFIKLIENLNLPRDLSRSPLVTAVFNLEKASLRSQSFGEEFTVNQNHTHTSQFDISWDITQTDNELFVECEYNNDLFDRQTIQRWLGHYVTLLEGMVARPEQYLWELPLLKEAEKLQLLVEWNNTQADYPKEQSIHQLFENQVEHTPDAIAVVFKEQQLTYRELNNQANQLAHYLQTLGVKPEVVVGVCVDRSLEMVIGLLGILKAGGAYLPLDPAYPQERLNFMLCDAQVSVLLTQEKLVAQLPEYGARVVKLDTDWGLIAQESEINLVSKITDHNLAFVIYTSGSTGTPKGVAIAHYSLLNLYQAWKNAYQSRTLVTSYLQTASFSFDVFSGDWIHALCCGAKLVLCPSAWLLNPAKLYELMLQEKVDCADFVPAIIRNLMRYLEETQQNINFMRLLVVGSDSFYVQEYEEFRRFCSPETRLINSYGVSEATVDSLYFESSEINLPLDSLVPIGKPFANTSIYILDDHLQPVPIGVTGELYIGGHGLARCYFNNPKLTAEKFIPNPFHDFKLENRYENFANPKLNRLYKTGDLARYLNDGNIEFLGRSDRQVKIRGFRIELGEIEALLIQHPEVKESVVISREDDPGDKRLVAYIVPPPKTTPSISNLRQFLQQKLPDYMIPTAFVLQKELPLTPNGKIDRQNLPAPDTNRPKLQENFLAPRDILELQLVQIWERLLNVSPIGITDNFFDLGGHSLLAVRLMAQIHKQLGQNLLISTLFQGATIEHLASILRQSANCVRSSPLVAIQPHGSKPPLFFVHPIGGNVLCYYELARNLQPDQPFYGLQSLGLDGESQPHTSIEDMATEYIKALRVVQPQGPYFLGGWSMGGVVAFEMAQQLHSQGHQVGLLALLDTLAPIPSNKPAQFENYDSATVLINLAGDMANSAGKNCFISEQHLQQLEPEEQLNYFWEQAKIANLIPLDIGIEQLRCFLRVFQSNNQALWNYKPQIYPHPIQLFRARERTNNDLHNPTLGWDQLSAQALEIIAIPGNHYTILSLPHIQELKQRLKYYLDGN